MGATVLPSAGGRTYLPGRTTAYIEGNPVAAGVVGFAENLLAATGCADGSALNQWARLSSDTLRRDMIERR